MADDLLKELLTSPLEEPKRRERRRLRTEATPGERPTTEITPDGSGATGSRVDMPRVPMGWGLGSAALAAAIVIAGYSIATGEPPETTSTTTTSTTLAAIDPDAPAGLPAGYVAVGDRLGMHVERILVRPDGVFVTVTTVVANGFDPDGTTGYQGGLWTLVLDDGRRITSTSESFDPLARGVVSVWFPQDGFTASEITGLELNGLADRTTATIGLETGETGVLPDDGSAVTLAIAPVAFGLDVGVDLVTEAVELSRTDARVAWRLGGDELASAAVTALALTTIDGEQNETTMFGTFQSTGFANFHPSIPGPVLETGGVVAFGLPDGNEVTADSAVGARIELGVTWAVYDPIVVQLPLVDASVTELSG